MPKSSLRQVITPVGVTAGLAWSESWKLSQVLTVDETAALCGVTQQAVIYACKRRYLTCRNTHPNRANPGGRWLIYRASAMRHFGGNEGNQE